MKQILLAVTGPDSFGVVYTTAQRAQQTRLQLYQHESDNSLQSVFFSDDC